MKTTRQCLRVLFFILICSIPALIVTISEWPRFDWRFVVGGLMTFALTSLSFLPALVGPKPRSLVYGAAFLSAGILLSGIRLYHYQIPLHWVDLGIPFCLAAALIGLSQYSCEVGGLRKGWRDIVAAIATVLGALSGFLWGIITSTPPAPL